MLFARQSVAAPLSFGRSAFFVAIIFYMLHLEFSLMLAPPDSSETMLRRPTMQPTSSPSPSPTPAPTPSATLFTTLNKLGGTEFPSRHCEHHLCLHHQVPDAAVYGCDPNPPQGREWTLTVLPGGMGPLDEGPERENDFDFVKGGHVALTRSARDGMRKLGDLAGVWNWHPSHWKMLGDVIWMPTCNRPAFERVTAVLRARVAHNKTVRAFVVCGPHGLTMQNNSLAREELMGFLIIPSPWVMLPGIATESPATRMRVLAAGVDVDRMRPRGWVDGVSNLTTHPPQRKAVVYTKHFTEGAALNNVRTALQKDNFTIVNINYGGYTYDSFHAALDGAQVAFFFVKSESQGLAIAEAWSMNVPTFVYISDASLNHKAYGTLFMYTSASPYLNYKTGLFFRQYDKIRPALLDMARQKFEPRKYVLTTMSDEVAAYNTLRAIQCEWERRKKYVWV